MKLSGKLKGENLGRWEEEMLRPRYVARPVEPLPNPAAASGGEGWWGFDCAGLVCN